MAKSIADRVVRRPAALRETGLRPVRIWAPDTRSRGFARECGRQSMLASQADQMDADLSGFLDAALVDVGANLDSR